MLCLLRTVILIAAANMTKVTTMKQSTHMTMSKLNDLVLLTIWPLNMKDKLAVSPKIVLQFIRLIKYSNKCLTTTSANRTAVAIARLNHTMALDWKPIYTIKCTEKANK